MISKLTSEHAGEPDSNGMYKVLSKIQILSPGEICTDSYLIACENKNKKIVENFFQYLKTKFVRFLLLQAVTSINLSKEKFMFVPEQDFSQIWTDERLNKKYELTEKEINLINSIIRSLDQENSENNG